MKMLAGALLIFSCATPIAPTGGPADTTGPEVVFTAPETGTVNFKGNKFEFGFSEYINRANFTKALTVEPDLGIPYNVEWQRKKATLKFSKPLPDSTTVIITLGADMADSRNNKMGSPIKVAVSTGDEIDGGEIIGRIYNATDGSARRGQRVLLYRYPADFTEKAVYAAETDTGGVFEFKYLREGSYQAIMLDDRNRNKIWERDRETARSFAREWFELEKGRVDTISTAFWFEADTVKPVLQAVGLLSSQMLRLRFSKEIRFTDAVSIQVTDSLEQRIIPVLPLNISEKEPFIAFGFSPEALSPTKSYFIEVQGIADASENPAIGLKSSFMGSSQPDTTSQRIINSNEKSGLFPQEAFVAEYAAPINDSDIRDSIVVVEGDVSFDNWPGIRIEQNKVIISPQEERWIEGVEYQFLLWEPAQQKRRLFKPSIWNTVDFGAIEVNVAGGDSTGLYRLEIINEDRTLAVDTVFSGQFLWDAIPPVSYDIRVYEDVNGNGKWDFGSVTPYSAPEPYYFRKGVKVQKGFTTEVPVKF